MQISFLAHKSLIAILILFCVWSMPVLAEKAAHILIVANSNEQPYQEAIAGFKQQIPVSSKIKFTELMLASTQSSINKEIDSVKPDLIYALGGEAIKWVNLQTTTIPIVGTMVLKPDVFEQASNITGISLGYPLKTQFQWLRKFFPRQTSVAILFNPSENRTVVEAARQIGQQNGFNLIAIPVETPKELPYALEQLANNVELLLAIPDETVMSVNTAKEVLLASFRNKVPLIGISDNWVKSGALYALSWDYEDLGKQCAVMAQKILNGAPVQTVSPEFPRKVTYTINTKISEHMNMDIPVDILNNAKLIYN
jgi:putative ABC transport system substrate-binding protein